MDRHAASAAAALSSSSAPANPVMLPAFPPDACRTFPSLLLLLLPLKPSGFTRFRSSDSPSSNRNPGMQVQVHAHGGREPSASHSNPGMQVHVHGGGEPSGIPGDAGVLHEDNSRARDALDCAPGAAHIHDEPDCTAIDVDSKGSPDTFRRSGENGALRQWWSWFPIWPALPTKEEFIIVPPQISAVSFDWEGWGTSLCWWANFAGGLEVDTRDYILDLLYDPLKGLGLNIARYNIGGGANPEVNEYLRPFGHVPGFKSGPNAPYDWDSDVRQKTILFGARDRGANIFEAFCNSPPYWMTLSGSVTGNTRWGQDNLSPFYDEAFVDYLTEVVKYFGEEWGLYFDYIAPFNEPVEGWWNINRQKKTAQEGCNFTLTSINRVIPKLKKALAEKRLKTKISAFDAWSQNTVKVLKALDETALSAIDQINVHTYVFVTSREDYAKRKQVREAVKTSGKKIWMSEYGPLNWCGEDIDVALGLGRHITLDLNELQVSAWCYWQALEMPGSLWGLLQTPFSYDTHATVVNISKQYYVFMQFTKWIKPGFKIFPTESLADCLVIALNPVDNTVVIVITNGSEANRDYSYDISSLVPSLEGKCIQAALFRTSATEDHVELPNMTFDNPTALIRAVCKSVTTMVVSKERK